MEKSYKFTRNKMTRLRAGGLLRPDRDFENTVQSLSEEVISFRDSLQGEGVRQQRG